MAEEAIPELSAPYAIKPRACRCKDIPREPLFSWGDPADETYAVYTVPKHFEAHAALDYLDLLYREGSDAALRWAIILGVGADGWNALRDPAIDAATFDKICDVILSRIRGALRSGPKAD